MNCPSLDYVYDMTYAEFLIRSYAYHRIQKNEWRKVRRIAFASLIGPHYDPKKLPKSEEKYMALDERKKSRVTKEMREQFLEASKQYYTQKNGS